MRGTTQSLDDFLRATQMTPNCTQQHKGYERDDNPPSKCVVLTTRYYGPKKNSLEYDDFPFDTTKNIGEAAMTVKEVLEWQIDRCQRLIELYEKQKEQIPNLISANRTAYFNAKASDRRKYFYYCFLHSIANATPKVAFEQLDKLSSLRKLWRNRIFIENNQVGLPDKCCAVPGCTLIAIHGSYFCGWHILKDPKQQLYHKCPVCGSPRLINDALPCPGHKAGKGKDSKPRGRKPKNVQEQEIQKPTTQVVASTIAQMAGQISPEKLMQFFASQNPQLQQQGQAQAVQGTVVGNQIIIQGPIMPQGTLVGTPIIIQQPINIGGVTYQAQLQQTQPQLQSTEQSQPQNLVPKNKEDSQ